MGRWKPTLPYHKVTKQWRKVYKGKTYYLGAAQAKSDRESHDRALAKWEAIKAEVDVQPDPGKPNQKDYDLAIDRWEKMAQWYEKVGDNRGVTECTTEVEALKKRLAAKEPSPLDRWERNPLTLQVIDFLGDLSAGQWGNQSRTILTAAGAVVGTFDQLPSDPHLGHGVFYQGVVYDDHSVVVDLLQAAPGAMTLKGQHALGDVVGETDVDLASDLTLLYTIEGQAGLFEASVVVPEPSTLALLASGLLGLLLWRRRRAV